jgi:small GTP-binding protein
MTEDIHIKRKIVLVGDYEVGKTSLLRKFVFDTFSDKYIMSVGLKVTSKKLEYQHSKNNSKITLNLMIWDIMGQKGYKLVPETAFHGAKGALIVCDLTRTETIHNLTFLTSWLFEIASSIPVIFLANKVDLVDKSSLHETAIADIATAFKAPYAITSAKTGENVNLAFNILGRMILKQQGI